MLIGYARTSTVKQVAGWRRMSLARGDGVTTTYGYDEVSRLSSLTLDLAGTAQDQAYGYSYHPASQILTRTASNDAYAYAGAANADRGYAPWCMILSYYVSRSAATATAIRRRTCC